MTNEVKNVPEIRFPEFSGEWEEKMLGDVLTILDGDRGNNYPSQSDFLEFGHTLFLNASNVTKNGFSFTQKQYITEKKSISLGNGKLVKDDVVLTTRGSIGNIAWYDEEIYREIPYARINSGMLILRSNNKDMASFVSQFLKSIKGKRQIDRISFGSAQPQLTKKDIKLYRITFPQIKEQRKIGAFFSKLDRQIELEEQKLEKLEEQKKGYMQQIFSQKLRFKDVNGNDYPEWENKKFLEIFKLVPSKKNQIKSSEVVENGIIPVVDQGKNIFLGYSNEKSKAIEDFDNVIVYGDHTTIVKYIKEPFIIGGDGVKLLTSNEDSLIHYLYILLQHFNVNPEGYKRHYSILKTKKMNISNTKEEQEKIGNFFEKQDNLIEKQSDKVELLKNRKKGFLHKMFV